MALTSKTAFILKTGELELEPNCNFSLPTPYHPSQYENHLAGPDDLDLECFKPADLLVRVIQDISSALM